MQKLIAKYGLAAHLALLAAAPLLLFPFCAPVSISVVILWLSLLAGLWTVLEPSTRSGEHLRDARRRVLSAIVRDPLFWCLLLLIVFVGFRALNTGIAIRYDAEKASWYVSEALFPLFPAVVGDAGILLFAVAVSFLVILQACRHSLGRSARMAFLLLASSLSGLAAVIALLAAYKGHAGSLSLLKSVGSPSSPFVGFAFGLYLLGGLVSLVAIFEHHWHAAFALLILSVGGNGAGLFAFAPAHLSAALLVMMLVALAYALAYSAVQGSVSIGVKVLVLFGTALVAGCLMAAALLPRSILAGCLEPFCEFNLIPARFWEGRSILSAVASESWSTHPWIGTGIGSFSLDFRFGASDAGWELFPGGAALPFNGWWLLLSERGIIGAVVFALPLGFLLFTYFRRLVGWAKDVCLPHPACLMAPIAFLAFVLIGFFDCSPLRAEAYVALGSMLAVSAAAFPTKKKD